MKERIIELLKKHSLPLKVLLEFFGDTNETLEILGQLEDEGKIIKVRKNYYLPEQLNLVRGKIISVKDGFSFASIGEEDDVYISNYNLNGAILDDEVYLKKINAFRKAEYEVYSIIKRNKNILVGELLEYNNYFYLDVKGIASKEAVFLIDKSSIPLEKGKIASCRIIRQSRETYFLEVISLLGGAADKGVDITKIIYSYNATIDFPSEVIEQVKNIPTSVLESELEGREDFRDHVIVTIDGDDAKDFDDAVEVERCAEGYIVGVHIADVAHYVQRGTPLDKEALQRGTSIYVADRVVPMLPFELSNGICSLNPNVDRLVTSCIFTVDCYGNILNSRITKGVIRSHARLTYNYVNKLLNKEKIEKRFPREIDDLIYLLNEVSRKIRKNRSARGSIDLETTEIKFVLDSKGQPIDVIKRKQGDGEKLIEDLMIAANEQVAETIEAMGLPFIYRIHEQPKAKKMDAFMKLSAHLGEKTDFDPLVVKPIELANFIRNINDETKKKILSMMLLRSLAKARYAPYNKHHFGLSSTSYTHFTSPIRRYPDLLVHRLINRYLVEGNINFDSTFEEEIAFIAENCSIYERRAISIEREVDDLESAKYMSKHIDEEFKGYINGMTNKGFFVELDNGINGFVDFMDLSDTYTFNETYMCATGAFTKKSISLGDIVSIVVKAVDIDTHRITFTLLNEAKVIKNIKRPKFTNVKRKKMRRRR